MNKVLIYSGALGVLVSISACANNDAGKFKDGSSVNIKGTAELCNDILNGKAPESRLCQDWRTFNDEEMQKAVMTINGYTKILQSGKSIKNVSQEYARSLVQDTPISSSSSNAKNPSKSDSPFPFPANCKAMQRYFNKNISWSKDVKFEGYQNARPNMLDEGRSMECFGGYFTEITPVRKTVCKGYIKFNVKNGAYYYALDTLEKLGYGNVSEWDRCSFDPPLYP